MPKNKNTGTIIISTDGGSRGNPGPSAIGVVLRDESGDRIEEISRYIGETTNNVAEYLAVIYALQEASRRKASSVRLKVDSQLVARQLKGEYKVKDKNIRIFFDLALNLLKCFDKIEILEVPREENKEADVLVNRALDLKTLL
jgi:ribonuclease HI